MASIKQATMSMLSVLFTLTTGSEITCNTIEKGHYYGNYGYADVHNSYDFSITSDESWVVFQSCQSESGESSQSGDCNQMDLYKFETEWEAVSRYTDMTAAEAFDSNECATLTVNNITSGAYRLFSASCAASNYSLFMGCSNDSSTITAESELIFEIESDVSCGITVSGMMRDASTQYYTFNVVDRMEWVSFDTCTDTKFYVDSLVISMFGGRFKVMQSGAYSANCLKLNATNLPVGVYYIAVNGESGSESDGEYTLDMECSNDAAVLIAADYNEYAHDPHAKHHKISYFHVIAILLTVVTLPLIGSCLFYNFWKKKLRKVAKDVIYTQSVQHVVANDEEEDVDDVEVAKNAYDDHAQLTVLTASEEREY